MNSLPLLPAQRNGAPFDPLHDAIAAQASALWRRKGCPEGRDVEIWLEAEWTFRRLRRAEQDNRDERSLASPRFLFDRENGGILEKLEAEFPGPTNRGGTSL